MTDLPTESDMDALPSGMFDRVIRALDVAYYEWTVGSAEIRVSSALADMFGFDPDTWTVKRQTELIHPDDRPGFRAALATGFKSGAERVEFTCRMRRSAGDYRWLINRGVLERNEMASLGQLTAGIAHEIKIFTTKPAGEGTGLGLSVSYDIVVKQHGGQLTVDSRLDAFTEFVVMLPRRMAASEVART